MRQLMLNQPIQTQHFIVLNYVQLLLLMQQRHLKKLFITIATIKYQNLLMLFFILQTNSILSFHIMLQSFNLHQKYIKIRIGISNVHINIVGAIQIQHITQHHQCFKHIYSNLNKLKKLLLIYMKNPKTYSYMLGFKQVFSQHYMLLVALKFVLNLLMMDINPILYCLELLLTYFLQLF